MVIFESIKFKNFLSYGNTFTEIPLNTVRTTLSTGINGQGKCLNVNTFIEIQNKYTGEIQKITIGELYDQENKNSK
jgi:hypothetical protein